MRINFFYEIVEALKEHDKSINDIQWIGSDIAIFDTESFLNWSKNFDYDNGYGGNVIPLDIVVVGTDWWLERAEYDGYEWWEYKKQPDKKDRVILINGTIDFNKLYGECYF